MVQLMRVCRLQTEQTTTVERRNKEKGWFRLTFFSLPPLAKVVCLSRLPPALEWVGVGGGRKRSCALLEVGGAGWREKEGQEGRGTLHYVRTCPDPDSTRYSPCPRHAPSCRHCTLTRRLSAQTILRTTSVLTTWVGYIQCLQKCTMHMRTCIMAPPPSSSHHTTPHHIYNMHRYLHTYTYPYPGYHFWLFVQNPPAAS